MSKLFEALNDAADGAFVVDENLHILYWNEAAEDLLKFEWEGVAGLPCYRILLGYDEEKRLICKKHCQVSRLVVKSKPVSNYDIHMQTKRGNKRWLNMSVFTYQMNEKVDNKVIVHLFRDINDKKEAEIFLNRLLAAARKYHSISPDNVTEPEILLGELTQREHEILTHLAQGHGTGEIGERLAISPNTVRNHIQHVLEKLQVHSRLEAVTFAIKHDMVG